MKMDVLLPSKAILETACMMRMISVAEKKPSLVLAVDEFGFYVGSVHGKSFGELSDEEFTKYKNEFVLALEEDLCKIHKFSTSGEISTLVRKD